MPRKLLSVPISQSHTLNYGVVLLRFMSFCVTLAILSSIMTTVAISNYLLLFYCNSVSLAKVNFVARLTLMKAYYVKYCFTFALNFCI